MHDGYLRTILWKDVFKNSLHVSSPHLIFWILGSTLAVFFAGSAIDLIRQALSMLVYKLAYLITPTFQSPKSTRDND